jgi:hypothetical protein
MVPSDVHACHAIGLFVAEADMPSPLAEYNPELEVLEGEQSTWPGERGPEGLNETDELELAAELLAVTNEQELDQLLGTLIRKVGRTVGQVVRTPVAQAVGGVLKGLVTTALPRAGGVFGSFLGGPLGATIGSRLASVAGRALGLELEGLSHEDQEFEAARRFVRFAGEAVSNAAAASPAQDPVAAAQTAVAAAAERLAPGLLKGPGPIPAGAGQTDRGRWVRQGRNVIVVNC